MKTTLLLITTLLTGCMSAHYINPATGERIDYSRPVVVPYTVEGLLVERTSTGTNGTVNRLTIQLGESGGTGEFPTGDKAIDAAVQLLEALGLVPKGAVRGAQGAGAGQGRGGTAESVSKP